MLTTSRQFVFGGFLIVSLAIAGLGLPGSATDSVLRAQAKPGAATQETASVPARNVMLTGTITSASGEKMEGVTVSARAPGSTYTTSVFTDAEGEFYFPRMDRGKYKVW